MQVCKISLSHHEGISLVLLDALRGWIRWTHRIFRISLRSIQWRTRIVKNEIASAMHESLHSPLLYWLNCGVVRLLDRAEERTTRWQSTLWKRDKRRIVQSCCFARPDPWGGLACQAFGDDFTAQLINACDDGLYVFLGDIFVFERSNKQIGD